jgi:hypothetical protein
MTPAELKPLLLARTREVVQKLLPNGKEHGNEWLIGSTGGEAGKSMRIRLEGDHAGLWLDWDSGQKGDIIELWKLVRGLSFKEALKEIHEFLGLSDEEDDPKKPSQTWTTLQREMGQGIEQDLRELQSLRRLPNADGLRLALENQHLFFGPVSDGPQGGPYTFHHSWIVTDASRRGAQARRMDGKPWFDGQKAKTIHSTTGRWPIGIAESALPEIAFTEGGPDFLAAYTAVAMLGLADRIQPVSLFGSQQVIHPDALRLFSQKTVWMFFHADANYSGLHGAMKWEKALHSVGATVIPFDFTQHGCKDLNEFISALDKDLARSNAALNPPVPEEAW